MPLCSTDVRQERGGVGRCALLIMTRKKILLLIALVLLGIQAIRPNRSVPDVDPSQDFIAIYPGEPEIEQLFKDACYDCHSHETTYPWYSEIAPVSWIVQDHVNHGKEHLNFNEWGLRGKAKRSHALEEMVEETLELEMPLKSYANMHPEAQLTAEQRKQLAAWWKSLRP